MDATDHGGNTPLHYAAKNGRTSATIEALLKAGADVDARQNGGKTPLHFARDSKVKEILKAHRARE